MAPPDLESPPSHHPGTRPSFSVATFNVHAGVDGWGRRFDVVAACRTIDADVIVLQETWTPQHGPGIAEIVGASLGYSVFEQPFAGGRLAAPYPQAARRRGKRSNWRGPTPAIYFDSQRPAGAKVGRSSRYLDAEPGRWGVAVLSRIPALLRTTIDLGRLAHDPARRFALVIEIQAGGTPVTVIGTHMSHISYGAPLQYVRLRRAIRDLTPDGGAILAGDMNLWGPPLLAFFPGWHRALRQRTWPAWRPHSQVDHILIRGPLAVDEGRAFPFMGSDHLALRAGLTSSG